MEAWRLGALCPRRCYQLRDLGPLGQALAQLQRLQSLHLNFAECYELREVGPLGQGLRKLQRLQSLHLNFDRCSRLPCQLQEEFGIRDRAAFLAALGRAGTA